MNNNTSNLSNYEKKRLLQIKKNKDMIISLGLDKQIGLNKYKYKYNANF